jgi:hypothetical protein
MLHNQPKNLLILSFTLVLAIALLGPVWAGASFDVNMSCPFLSGAAILLVGFLISLAGIKAHSLSRYKMDLNRLLSYALNW